MVSDLNHPKAAEAPHTTTDTVIIGAGPAGVSLSVILQRDQQRNHVVLEKGEAFDNWKHLRWDGFKLNTMPKFSWLPGEEHLAQSNDPPGAPRDVFLARWEALVNKFNLPIREHSRVVSVHQCDAEAPADGSAGPRFRVQLADGSAYLARNVVAAVGACGVPKPPSFASDLTDAVTQWVPGKYTNPSALGNGKVLVVGSAQTGGQIAKELLLAGKEVLLSTGRVPSAPRNYRGLDLFEFILPLFSLTRDAAPPEILEAAPPTIGADCSITLHSLSRLGATLLGRCAGAHADGAGLEFAADLASNVEFADAAYQGIVGMIEQACAARIEAEGEAFEKTLIDYEPEDASVPCESLASYMQTPKASLRFEEEGITDVFWATGFSTDDTWLQIPGVREDKAQKECVGIETPVPGFFWLGQPWSRNHGSEFLTGFRDDAAYLAQKLA